MSLFVVLEGPDGSGKSTQVELLASALRAEGRTVLTTREPGGTPAGDAMRELMLGAQPVEMMPLTWALLMNAARAELVETIIRPALNRGAIVISDRYWYSTAAYQSAGEGLSLDVVSQLSTIATSGLTPSLIVLLDAPAEVALERKRFQALNVLDNRPIEFHRRVVEAYRAMARDDSKRWKTIDAGASPDTVQRAVLAAVLCAAEAERSRPGG